MTDKGTMEQYYNYVVSMLERAEENLEKAEEILRSDFVVDNSGYCANNINEKKSKIYGYRQDINKKIIPAIKEL